MKLSESYKKRIQELSGIKQAENVGDLYLEQDELNAILKGYLESALWTEEERLKDDYDEHFGGYKEGGEEDDEETEVDKLIRIQNDLSNKPFESFITDDLEDDSKIQAYLDIKTFLNLAGNQAISEALDTNDAFRLGMDIWLTRNGHGSGFFDHNYEFENELMNAAKTLKGVDLYITDDAKIAFSNSH